jgi:hypothetical protein
MRWRFAVALALLVGCPTPPQYKDVRPGLSCERATRVVHRTLVAMGYTITDIVPAQIGGAGHVTGVIKLPDGATRTGRANITCDAEGATVTPIEDSALPNYEFSRGFTYAFRNVIQLPDEEKPRAASGLQVLVQAITPSQAVLDLGGVPNGPAAMPIRVTVRNDTDRPVAIDPARIDLVPGAGDATGPLAGSAFDAALAPGAAADRLRRERLTARKVPAHTTVRGYLLYPVAAYTEARVAIEDVETGEAEGFVAPVE